MLYQYHPSKKELKNAKIAIEKGEIPSMRANLINASKIVKVTENLSTDVQDYDLILEDGAEVVLHIENCNGRIPQEGDYFYIDHSDFIFLKPAKEFKAIYKPANE